MNDRVVRSFAVRAGWSMIAAALALTAGLAIACEVVARRLASACGACAGLTSSELDRLAALPGIDGFPAIALYLPMLLVLDLAVVALGIVGAIRVAQPGGARQFKWRAWVALALVVVGLGAQWAIWRNTILVISAVVE